MDELICVGKVINFFGIKGELKVLSNFDKKELAFKIGMKVLIKEENLEITSIRYHKNYILIRVNDIQDINLITKYIGFNIYVKKGDLGLSDTEYILEELVGFSVIDDGETLGVVVDTLMGKGANYIKVSTGQKEFLIPLVDVYIKKFERNNKLLYTTNAKSLII